MKFALKPGKQLNICVAVFYSLCLTSVSFYDIFCQPLTFAFIFNFVNFALMFNFNQKLL
jgi:hypothetical protein